MFEFTIVCKGNSQILNNIHSSLKPIIENLEGIVIKHCNELSFAVKNQHSEFLKPVLAELISENIVNFYKYQFLSQNIMLNIKNRFTYKSFLQSLVVFDAQTDSEIIKKNLVLDRKINIDSFYLFQLFDLRSRWLDIAMVVNESMPIILKDKSLAQLTQYFVSATTTRVEELHIYGKGKQIWLEIDGKESDLVFDDSVTAVENIVIEAISLNPKKIYLHGHLPNYQLLNSKLQSVFSDKIFSL